MSSTPRPFFLPIESGRGGQRFCLFHAAHERDVRGSIVYLHPLAEEMNKSRRMAALQSRALARAGFEVLQIDLLGCGDSSGDFCDATWHEWINDAVHACGWLRRHHRQHGAANTDEPPIWLWGLRTGCLLATEAANLLNEPCNFLFWQPPSAGKQLLQQFLRLKAAGDMMGGTAKAVMQDIRVQLSSGTSVDIAGYMLSSGLAAGIEQAQLHPPNDKHATRLEWLDISTREDAILSPGSANTIALWRQAGYDAHSHIVNGPAFWQTTEIEDAPALVAATVAAISGTSIAEQANGK